METLQGGEEERLVLLSLQETTRECHQGPLIPTMMMMMMMMIIDQTLLSLIVAPEAQKSCGVERKLHLVL